MHQKFNSKPNGVGIPSLTRWASRGLTIILFGLLLNGYILTPSLAAPVGSSDLINTITFDETSLQQHGQGSDQWSLTQADDGQLYAFWGDGSGWGASGDKYYLGVTRLSGTPPSISGTDVYGNNSHNWKPLAAIAASNHTMYLFATTDTDEWGGSYLATSHDNGSSWSYGNRLFSTSTDNLQVWGFAQFGPGYTNLPSNIDHSYFYLYFKSANNQSTYLARVPIASLAQKEHYEFFSGTTGSNQPIWSTQSNKQALLSDPADSEWGHVGVAWNPALGRYFMSKRHNNHDLGIFESPTLWGPWKTVYYGSFLNNYEKFTYQLPQKWLSSNGLTWWMGFSGWPEYDNFNLIKLTLELKSSTSTCTSDYNGDRVVGIGDLLVLLNHWQGIISDLINVLNAWGTHC